ncbi:hypothetical protein PRZ48_010110 [Zasmidium cellare]|uniref:Uncharacterized protein n=1 Tax=Zasmidium cellare TaxID=395010 RepID=A0ABR0EDL6_ZASCE|nr:hypothetical protein PRZ48_010110 [Zasmidium cellare]
MPSAPTFIMLLAAALLTPSLAATVCGGSYPDVGTCDPSDPQICMYQGASYTCDIGSCLTECALDGNGAGGPEHANCC